MSSVPFPTNPRAACRNTASPPQAGDCLQPDREAAMLNPGHVTIVQGFSDNLDRLFKESAGMEQEIRKQLAGLRYDGY